MVRIHRIEAEKTLFQNKGTHLWRSGQREQQVQRGLGEVEVLLGSQAELHGAEHRGQDGDPPHHRHPVLAVLVGAAQLLGQVQGEHAHLQGIKMTEERLRSRIPAVQKVEKLGLQCFQCLLTPSLWSFWELRGQSVSMLSSSSAALPAWFSRRVLSVSATASSFTVSHTHSSSWGSWEISPPGGQRPVFKNRASLRSVALRDPLDAC